MDTTNFPVLETECLLLRQPALADTPLIYRYLEDGEIARNMRRLQHPYPAGEAERWVDMAQELAATGEAHHFAIVRKPDTLFMGMARVTYEHTSRHAELGYWLGKPFWGSGYMTEVVRCLIQFAFAEMDMYRVYAHYFVRNDASRRVMEKAGMTYEGAYRQHWLKNGVYEDWGLCGILRDEWKSL